ncbi:hypothetical protein HA402_013018 [Bradysia odoriphaga]|nr:hypothetical protein HA402_013018 [Bradysia odoriphaga]
MSKFEFLIVLLHLVLNVQCALHRQGDLIVAKDGTGDFGTIQEAVNASPNNSAVPTRIYIKSGEYFEKITVPAEKTQIHFIGADKSSTIINYDDYSGKPQPDGVNLTTSTSYTVLVRGDDFYAEDLTFLNSAGTIAQAVALHVVADRVVINNCNIIANQDTLYPTIQSDRPSRQYYKDCFIEGTTDFIFGAATALFENCIIQCLKNSYITAASTPEGNDFGFVFKNCSLLGNEDTTSVYLGRPWRPWARTVFIHTTMDSHIHPAGWHNWNNPDNEDTAFYAEYMTHGVDVTERVAWSKQLTDAEAELYTMENIFAGEDGSWLPNSSSNVFRLDYLNVMLSAVVIVSLLL